LETQIGDAQHRSQALDLTPSTLNLQNLHCFPSSPHHHGRPEGRAAAGEHPRSKGGRSWPYSRRSRTWYCPPSAPTTEARRRRSTPAGCTSFGQETLAPYSNLPANSRKTENYPYSLLRHLSSAISGRQSRRGGLGIGPADLGLGSREEIRLGRGKRVSHPSCTLVTCTTLPPYMAIICTRSIGESTCMVGRYDSMYSLHTEDY
jgi:hypothetical protein